MIDKIKRFAPGNDQVRTGSDFRRLSQEGQVEYPFEFAMLFLLVVVKVDQKELWSYSDLEKDQGWVRLMECC